MRIIRAVILAMSPICLIFLFFITNNVVVGCGRSSSGPTSPSNIPIAIEGLGGSEDIPVSSIFQKDFEVETDCTTVTVLTFFIVLTPEGSSGEFDDVCIADNRLETTISCDPEEDAATLDPTYNLLFGTDHTICLTSGILDTDGGAILEAGDSVSFTTEVGSGTITISPETASVSKGSTQEFTATDQDSADITGSATWYVLGGLNNGTIALNAEGTRAIYTAPSNIIEGGVTIAALGESASSTATVNITVGETLTFTTKPVPTTGSSDCAAGYIFRGVYPSDQALALDNESNDIYIAWDDYCDGTGISSDLLDMHIYISRSTDGGEEFSRSDELASHLRVYEGGYPYSMSMWPVIILDADNIDLAFTCIDLGIDTGNTITEFSRSTDLSQLTFPTPSDIGQPDLYTDAYYFPHLTVDPNGTLYAAIFEKTEVDPEESYTKVHLKKSTDSGAGWTSIEIDSYEGENLLHCISGSSIMSDTSGNIYIAYGKINDGDCKNTANVDNNKGSVWLAIYNGNVVSTPTMINSDDLSLNSNTSPKIAMDGTGVIHAVWAHQATFGGGGTGDDGTVTVYYATSEDGGITFNNQTAISSAGIFAPISLAFQPAIAIDQLGNVNVAYYKCDSSNCIDIDGAIETMNIYVARKRYGQTSWDNPIMINSIPGTKGLDSDFPQQLSLVTDTYGRLYLSGSIDSDSDDVDELFFSIGE